MTDACWSAYAVRYMRQTETRLPRDVYLDGREDEEPFPGLDYFFWVLTRGERVVVVDTGMSKESALLHGREWFGSPADLLAEIGIRADAVGDVILSHAHADHVGNLGAFPNATFWIQRQEMAAATGPEMTHPVFRRFYDVGTVIELVRLLHQGRLRFLDGDGNFEDGIRYYLVGGHAAGQMAVHVDTSRGPVLLASDAVHLYGEAITARPFFAFQDLMPMVEGYRRCLSLAGSLDTLVPGHDRLVSQAYPSIGPRCGVVFDLSQPPDRSELP